MVKKGATIGANATIICGVTIGSYSFIGAGSVVRDDVKPYAIMVGVPARYIGFMCECGIKLDRSSTKAVIVCRECNKEYKIAHGTCTRIM